MKIFKKIKIKSLNGKSRIINFFNISIFQYDVITKEAGKEKIFQFNFPFMKNKEKVKNKHKKMFYLKVNLEYNYAFVAIQQWVNIVNEYGGDFIFICDKSSLRDKILEKILFKDGNIKFMKSYKKPLKNIINKMVTKKWVNTGFAHLTTFYHAKKNNIDSFWNIDADDTSLIIEPKKAVEILKTVEKDCEQRDVSISSLDMWRSRSRSRQWTFGVTYTRNINKFIPYFENVKKEWQNEYLDSDVGLNIDWFITSLLDKNLLKIETWYVENLYFIHWCRDGNFFYNIMGSFLCFWHNGNIHYPIFEKIIEDTDMGIIPISTDIRKYDCNITLDESRHALINRFTRLKVMNKIFKKLWYINY